MRSGISTFAPGHEPVLSKDCGTSAGERRDLPRQVESRSHVRHNRDIVAERGPDVSIWLGVVRQRADGIGVDVVDMAGRQEGVKKCFDRGPPRPWLDHAVRQVVDHLLVAHRGTVA
jgi:hypothetical protein